MNQLTASGSGKRSGESAVDRLIELASDEKPATPPPPKEIEKARPEFIVKAPGEEKDMEENLMWKMLMQFKSALPYVARLLPLLDMGASHAQTSALSTEVRQQVGELQSSQQDLRVALQDQTVQLKRFGEQITRIREATEKNAFEHSDLAEDVKSMRTFVKTAAAILGVLLVALIGMVGFLLVHLSHR